VRAILRKGIKVFIVRVDDTCHSCTSGNFLGDSVDQVDHASFIKLKLNMNCLPPPHEPLFQENFSANTAELVKHIRTAFPDLPLAPAMSTTLEPEVEEVEDPVVKVATMQGEVTAIEKQIQELEQQKIAFATAKKFRDAGAAKVKISTTHSYSMYRLSARC
jgi:hypothetical protein